MRGAGFPLGHVVITRTALAKLETEDESAFRFLSRHARGDWGDLDKEDRAANEQALREDLRLLSAYETEGGTRLWVITEADRSVTTVLLPEDY